MDRQLLDFAVPELYYGEEFHKLCGEERRRKKSSYTTIHIQIWLGISTMESSRSVRRMAAEIRGSRFLCPGWDHHRGAESEVKDYAFMIKYEHPFPEYALESREGCWAK